MKISENKLNEIYVEYIDQCKELGIYSEELFNELGDKIKNAPFAPNVESGGAYRGALMIMSCRGLQNIAININNTLSENSKIDELSIRRVAILEHLSKCLIFEENNNDWEKGKGILYKYASLNTSLRTGERSILLCLKYGIKLQDNEFEAIRSLDKDNDDKMIKFYSSPITTIMRISNEILSMEAQNKFKAKQNEKKE